MIYLGRSSYRILLVGTLFELADFFVNKRVPFLVVLEILLLYIPAHMVMTFPISGLLASELSLGRLSRDSELIAMEASGISLRRIILPYIIFSIFCKRRVFCSQRYSGSRNQSSSAGFNSRVCL